MTRYTLGTLILTVVVIAGCERQNPTPAVKAQRNAADAVDRAAADMMAADVAKTAANRKAKDDKANADAKIAADAREAANVKADADRAAADAKSAADTKAATDAKAAADTKATADRVAADAKAASDAKVAADLKTAAEAKVAADAKIAVDTKTDAANTAKATSLLAELVQYIKENKIELAESTLTSLDGMKGSIPASLQDKIETARATLNAKKTAASLLK